MRDVLNEAGTELDMGRRRPTDMRNNREVKMPGPGRPQVEAEFSTRLGVWQAAFKAQKDKSCIKDGSQLRSNLSMEQQIGLQTLGKKVARLECIVMQADKGKGFVVCDEVTYRAMAQDHVGKDKETTKEEVARSQRVLTSMAKGLGNIFGVGDSPV